MNNLLALGLAALLLLGVFWLISPRLKGIIVLAADAMFIYAVGNDQTYGFHWHNLSQLGQFIAIIAGFLGFYWLFISGRASARAENPSGPAPVPAEKTDSGRDKKDNNEDHEIQI